MAKMEVQLRITPKNPVFHAAHYNKIAALLGRDLKRKMPLVASIKIEGKDRTTVINDHIHASTPVGLFVIMFEEDNPRFDTDKFLEAVVRHATQ